MIRLPKAVRTNADLFGTDTTVNTAVEYIDISSMENRPGGGGTYTVVCGRRDQDKKGEDDKWDGENKKRENRSEPY